MPRRWWRRRSSSTRSAGRSSRPAPDPRGQHTLRYEVRLRKKVPEAAFLERMREAGGARHHRRDARSGEPVRDPARTTDLAIPMIAAAVGDRYEVKRVIARGGMAIVYLAEDRELGRQVAIKLLDPNRTGSRQLSAERFLREVRITAQLQHPNIIPLIDSGRVKGLAYAVFPYVEGESLRDLLLRQPPRAPGRCAALGPRDRRGPRVRAPARHRAPRHQAGEHPAVQRPGGDQRLRRRLRAAPRRVRGRGHRRGRDARHAGVHEPGTDRGGHGRRPERHLQPGVHAVRDARRAAAVRRALGAQGAQRAPPERAAAARGDESPTSPTACRRSCGAPWPRSRRTGSRRRAPWRSRSGRCWASRRGTITPTRAAAGRGTAASGPPASGSSSSRAAPAGGWCWGRSRCWRWCCCCRRARRAGYARPDAAAASLAVLAPEAVPRARCRPTSAEGLAGEIIGVLQGHGGVRVTPQASSFALSGRSLPLSPVGDTLGVTNVLTSVVSRGWRGLQHHGAAAARQRRQRCSGSAPTSSPRRTSAARRGRSVPMPRWNWRVARPCRRRATSRPVGGADERAAAGPLLGGAGHAGSDDARARGVRRGGPARFHFGRGARRPGQCAHARRGVRLSQRGGLLQLDGRGDQGGTAGVRARLDQPGCGLRGGARRAVRRARRATRSCGCTRRSLAASPDLPDVLIDLGQMLGDAGHGDSAVALARAGGAAQPAVGGHAPWRDHGGAPEPEVRRRDRAGARTAGAGSGRPGGAGARRAGALGGGPERRVRRSRVRALARRGGDLPLRGGPE